MIWGISTTIAILPFFGIGSYVADVSSTDSYSHYISRFTRGQRLSALKNTVWSSFSYFADLSYCMYGQYMEPQKFGYDFYWIIGCNWLVYSINHYRFLLWKGNFVLINNKVFSVISRQSSVFCALLVGKTMFEFELYGLSFPLH